MILLVICWTMIVHFVVGEYSNINDLDPIDLKRAYQPRPLPDSHVIAADGKSIFSAMNNYLTAQSVQTMACEEFDHDLLNSVARQLFPFHDERLNNIYRGRNDRRQLHFSDMKYKEALWKEEEKMSKFYPITHGIGSSQYNMTRDGKCAELVMWWVHHLPISSKNFLNTMKEFKLPLLPNGESVQPKDQSKEYSYQVSCTSCHSVSKSNDRNKNRSQTHYPRNITKCPVDPKTKLPAVWYEPVAAAGTRQKRCDWDYDPPCQMCEGIGGIIWGDQEHELTYTSCTPLLKPADIPKDNLTSPLWPTQFTVNEGAIIIAQINEGGQFPGADPCAPHIYTNHTEVLYFDSVHDVMRYKLAAPQSKSVSDTWHLGNGNMFIKIDNAFCICVSVYENGNTTKKPMGPLTHDFGKDAILIGREKIGVEYINKEVVADHYNKGPHHFWVDVETNQWIRAWQPFNGLNVYATWNFTAPDPSFFKVAPSCYTGPLHKNISCVSPPPHY